MQPKRPNTLNHLAIIMDGNGRWAKNKFLPRTKGHTEGANTAKNIIEAVAKMQIPYLTLYAFSRENWKRPLEEISSIFSIFEFFIKKYGEDLIKNNIRLRVIGKYKELPKPLVNLLNHYIEATQNLTGLTLILALNYSSRSELLDALNRFTEDQQKNHPIQKLEKWSDFANYLDTKDIPDPDLIIRTSGENRTSNFLLLQGAFAEYYFSPKFWPDCGTRRLNQEQKLGHFQ